MDGTNNLTDEEKLLNFCKICLSQIDQNKKFKKTTRADLLRLLRPKTPEKTIKGYLKNNSGWKEGSLLRIYDDVIFDLFLTGLKIHSDRLDPDDDPVIINRFEYRYLDKMLKYQVDAVRDLKKENERLLDGDGHIPIDYHNEMLDQHNKEIKDLKYQLLKGEQDLENQRKHFEDMLQHERNQHKRIQNNWEKQMEKMLEDE